MDTQTDQHADQNQDEHKDEQPQEPTEVTAETKELEVKTEPSGPAPAVLPAAEGQSLPNKGKKPLMIAGIVLLFLAIGGAAYFAMNRDEPAPVTQTPVQTSVKLGVAVTLVDGTAQYSKDGEAWTTLDTGYEPAEGDWIKTDAGARTVLLLDDGTAIRLDETTTVRLTSLDAQDVRVDNLAGEVYSRVVASDRSYQVHVDDTDYQALGTAYKTINTTTEKGVQVYHSTVAVKGTQTEVTEGKQFYKSHSNAALTQGVTDVSVDEMKSDGFMVWNLEQDKQNNAFKDKLGYLTKIEEQPVPAPAPAPASASIKLTGKAAEKGVALSWSVSNIGSVEGFKVVRSKKTTTPTFGKDEANYASGASTRSLTWKDGSGITYHYRVCGYVNKTCTVYSNSVTVASPYLPPAAVTDGTMTLSIAGTTASWTFTGTAPHGYKIVVGSNGSTPTLSDHIKKYGASKSPQELAGLSSGTYSVRVCAYTADFNISNGCSNYSNTETLVIP